MVSYLSMKRGIALFVIAVGLLLFSEKTVSASEGTAFLTSDQSPVRCFAASVLVDVDTHQVVLSCRNLVIPQGPELLFYRAWAKRAPATNQTGQKAPLGGLVRSEYVSLGDLSNGKLTVRIRDAFTDVIVTIESQAQPKTPSLNRLVASGAIRPLEFGPTPTGGVQEFIQPSPTIVGPSATPTPKAAVRAQSRGVVGTAIRVFLVVVSVIVIVAIVISIIQRRSASS